MIRLYYIRMSEYAGCADEYFYSLMKEDVRPDMEKYRNEKVRRTKLIGAALVRKVLKADWGLGEGSYRMEKGEYGKPYISVNVSPVKFNISHSGDYLVAAFSDEEIGVDIEKITQIRMQVARRFFHPLEIRALEKKTREEQKDLFFSYWSVKESFLKYKGTGLSVPLSSFYVNIDRDAIRIEGVEPPVCIYPCFVDSGYKCFVCSSGVHTLKIEPYPL